MVLNAFKELSQLNDTNLMKDIHESTVKVENVKNSTLFEIKIPEKNNSNGENEQISTEELPENIANSFSFSEIKKKISIYHHFYKDYVSNMYNHMSSDKDLKNLTIFVLTIIGIIGVFIFKGSLLFY